MDLLDDPLITVNWLAANLERPDVKVLDGTWIMPGENPTLPNGYIPGAHYFDVDVVATPHPTLKHMLPSQEMFVATMSAMGIEKDDTIIIYDRHGVRTAPRVWWTFSVFGHAKAYILDGGLPAWIKAGHALSEMPTENMSPSHYLISGSILGVISQPEILAQLENKPQIADARPSGRFNGTQPEPRAGLRSGHIPGSFSLPYGSLQTPGGYFKPLSDIAEIIGDSGLDLTKPIITTCGSGITAAGIAFNLYRLGATNIRVYDGSWSEWGASDAPVSLPK